MWTEFVQRLAAANPEFTYDEVSDWDRQDLDGLTILGLLEELEPATHVICDACSEPHRERVRWSSDGKRAWIPCPSAGMVEVPTERLRRWRASAQQMSIELARAIGLAGNVHSLTATRLWSLGRLRVRPYTPHIFFAAIGPDALSSIVEEIRRAHGRVTGALLLPFSPEHASETANLRLFDLGRVSTFRRGCVTADISLIEDQFADDKLEVESRSRLNSVRSLSGHRRALFRAFIHKKELAGMEALAHHLGVSETALHGMARGDTKRYSRDKLNSVLKKMGCSRAEWDRKAKRFQRS